MRQRRRWGGQERTRPCTHRSRPVPCAPAPAPAPAAPPPALTWKRGTMRAPVASASSSSSTPPTQRTAGRPWCISRWLASSSKPGCGVWGGWVGGWRGGGRVGGAAEEFSAGQAGQRRRGAVPVCLLDTRRRLMLAAAASHVRSARLSPQHAQRGAAARRAPHWQMTSVAPLSLHCCTMSRKYCCSCARSASNCSTLLMSTWRGGGRAGVVCGWRGGASGMVHGMCGRGGTRAQLACVARARRPPRPARPPRTLCLVLGLGGSKGQVRMAILTSCRVEGQSRAGQGQGRAGRGAAGRSGERQSRRLRERPRLRGG